jgi:hypothetical protein
VPVRPISLTLSLWCTVTIDQDVDTSLFENYAIPRMFECVICRGRYEPHSGRRSAAMVRFVALRPRGETMCPFCLSTVGLIVVGTVSTGGLTALAVKISRKKKSTSENIENPSERSSSDVNQYE